MGGDLRFSSCGLCEDYPNRQAHLGEAGEVLHEEQQRAGARGVGGRSVKPGGVCASHSVTGVRAVHGRMLLGLLSRLCDRSFSFAKVSGSCVRLYGRYRAGLFCLEFFSGL